MANISHFTQTVNGVSTTYDIHDANAVPRSGGAVIRGGEFLCTSTTSYIGIGGGDYWYSGGYIEGINYLYEYDAGSLSGWMYKVNGLFPNYGCSKYEVKPGDAIVWMYTCDLGRDVGDNSTW